MRTRGPGTAALGAAALLAAATTATGASAVFTPAAPVAEIAYLHAVDVTSDVTSYLHVKYRPVGGAPCGVSPEADPGTYLFRNVTLLSGAQRPTREHTVPTPGTYLVCVWLRNNSSVVLASQSTEMTVRAPVASIAIEAPAYVPAGRAFILTVRGQTEVARGVYVTYRPAGGPPCAPSPDSDPGSTLIFGDRGEGAFAVRREVTLPERRRYSLCAWFVRDDDDIAPLATATGAISTVPPVIASPRPVVARVVVAPRRLVTNVRLPRAGRLTARLVRGNRRIGLAAVSAPGPRTVQIRYRRPLTVRPGVYVLEVRFTARGATRVSIVRRRVAVR